MPYRIFVSHCAEDIKIAEQIVHKLNNAFMTHIDFYFAVEEICGGELWKRKIQEQLRTCDAIISLFTPSSINKPWLYIEWSSFWISEKKYFLLLANGVKWEDLIHPMQDSQVINLQKKEDITKFFKALSEVSNLSKVPYSKVDDFYGIISEVCIEQEEFRKEELFNKYMKDIDSLPDNDYEIIKICNFFITNGDYEGLIRLIPRIRDDSLKASFAIQLIKRGRVDYAYQISENIIGNDKLVDIVLTFIDLQYFDKKELQEIILNISKNNQAELRKVIVYLINRGLKDSPIFKFTIERLKHNVELRKVAGVLLSKSMYRDPLYEELLIRMSINQNELYNALDELKEVDPDFFCNILRKGLLTNPDLLSKLSQFCEGK